MANHLARRYLARVSRRMPVGGKQKREFLSALRGNVDRYIQEHGNTTLPKLEEEFGAPDDIAADFISQMSYREINDKFRIKTRVIVTVLAAAFLVVAIWAVAVTILLDRLGGDADYGVAGEVVVIE